MDGSRFDALSRAFVDGHSRRRLVRLVMVVVLARTAAPLPLRETAAKGKKHKKHKKQRRGASPCVPNCEQRICGDDGCGGSCGTCAVDQVCADGRCASRCPSGQKLCGAACIPNNQCCGGCPAGALCQDGNCGFCATGESVCGQSCVNLATAAANCGRCGRTCPSGQCLNGACTCGVAGCPDGCTCHAAAAGAGGACGGNPTTTPCVNYYCGLGEVCLAGYVLCTTTC